MSSVPRILNGILNRAEDIFLSIVLLSISMVVFVNVVMRYGFAASTMWCEELTRYTLIWITFVGGSLCVRENYHPKIEALLMRVPANMRWIVMLSTAIIGVLFSVAMVVYGSQIANSAIITGHLTPSGLAPMYIALIGIPLGGVLMTIRYSQLAYGLLRKRSMGTEIY